MNLDMASIAGQASLAVSAKRHGLHVRVSETALQETSGLLEKLEAIQKMKVDERRPRHPDDFTKAAVALSQHDDDDLVLKDLIKRANWARKQINQIEDDQLKNVDLDQLQIYLADLSDALELA